jgi:type I restriction enzyme S subunit
MFLHHALREGDVITVRVGAPGVTCVVSKEADGLNCGSLMIIRRSPDFDSEWLANLMNSNVARLQIAAVQYGAAQEQINISDAVNFLIPTPPLVRLCQIRSGKWRRS